MTTASTVEPTRRDFLYIATGAVAAVGAAAVVWPLINQMSPDASTLAMASTEVDIGAIPEGQIVTIKWRGKPVFIRHRTAKEIAEATNVDVATLPDPQADSARVQKPQWLIVVGVCTHLGCIPLGHAGDYDGWFCPCHGSVYDTSGRIRKGPAPRNLAVPGLCLPDRHQGQDRLMTRPGARRASRHEFAKRSNMHGLSTFEPKNGLVKWLEARLPILSFMHGSFVAYPTPKNLNYWWTFGAILSFMLIAQIVTGIVLTMHYTPEATMAFSSVEKIMRDVNWGWMLRYAHANGASMFFFAVYIHMFRGIYYGSYKAPREVLWILGVIIFLLMMATGFMGYVLPWGQMSFWGATVITNLFSAIPLVGNEITMWLWGGYSVDNPTLNRFFALHYLLPFVIVAVVGLHVWALHVCGQNNPDGVEVKDITTRRTACPSRPMRR